MGIVIYGAASATTGIDYVADLVGPMKDEITSAVIAGLVLLVVGIAVRVVRRIYWREFVKTRSREGW